jgi:hypothetical protein
VEVRSAAGLVQRRFVKIALESDSGDGDHYSAIRRFLIGIIPEP